MSARIWQSRGGLERALITRTLPGMAASVMISLYSPGFTLPSLVRLLSAGQAPGLIAEAASTAREAAAMTASLTCSDLWGHGAGAWVASGSAGCGLGA